MFIINTDQGYITAGIPHQGLQFGIKEDARTFTEVDDSIINALHTYYCCEDVEIEYIKLNN